MEPIKLIPLHAGRAEAWSNGTENLSVHLTYDISNFLKSWPDAQPTVAFERADGQKYAHSWALQGAVLHIPLLQADTEIPGMCKCMITLTNGDGQANTSVFYGQITQGIDTLGETPSDPQLGIIEQVNAAALRAEAAANRAQNGGSGSTDGGNNSGSTGGGNNSGSIGGCILLVRISSEDGENFTSDTPYADIEAALQAGQMAYAIVENAYYAPLIASDEGAAIFSMVASIFGSITFCTAIIMADDTVTVSLS